MIKHQLLDIRNQELTMDDQTTTIKKKNEWKNEFYNYIFKYEIALHWWKKNKLLCEE